MIIGGGEMQLMIESKLLAKQAVNFGFCSMFLEDWGSLRGSAVPTKWLETENRLDFLSDGLSSRPCCSRRGLYHEYRRTVSPVVDQESIYPIVLLPHTSAVE